MTQIQKFELKQSLIKAAEQYENSARDLRVTIDTLPNCPCCPGDFCLLTFLRRDKKKAEKFSNFVGLKKENIFAALDGKYTLTNEECMKIANWINENN